MVEEIIAVMRAAGIGADGVRLRAFIVILWRAGLRVGEALALVRRLHGALSHKPPIARLNKLNKVSVPPIAPGGAGAIAYDRSRKKSIVLAQRKRGFL